MMLILIIDQLFFVYMILLFVRILSSWLPEYQHLRILQFIAYCTDPYLNIFRRIVPPLGILDISPIFAFISLGIIEYLIKGLVKWLF